MTDNKRGSNSSGRASEKGIFAWMADITPEQWKIFGVTFSGWTFAAMNIFGMDVCCHEHLRDGRLLP